MQGNQCVMSLQAWDDRREVPAEGGLQPARRHLDLNLRQTFVVGFSVSFHAMGGQVPEVLDHPTM